MSPKPTLPDETDILIIGGGIIGTATAFFLSKRTDRDLTLVEKDNIASGATGDSSAILRHVYGDRELYAEMAWEGRKFYKNFEEEVGYELKVPDQKTILWGGEDIEPPIDPNKSFRTLQSLDIPVTRYESEDFPDRYPNYRLDDVDFAISDDTAAYTDATTAANGFVNAAVDRGLRLVTGVGVESIKTSDGSVRGVDTEEGFIECEEVILAAGSWSYKLAATADVDLPITPGREQVLLLGPPEEVVEAGLDVPTTIKDTKKTDGAIWYIRADFSDHIYMGTHAHNDPVDPDNYKRQTDQHRLIEAFDFLDDFAPSLTDSDLIGDFSGIYANTPDQGFIIDQVGPDKLFALVGAGHAFKHGPVIGQLAADLVLEGESERFDLDHFTLDRFDDTSPQQPLTGESSPGLHMSKEDME
jgi:glycine/D-amino acid oxidase-like deaminating enzyme